MALLLLPGAWVTGDGVSIVPAAGGGGGGGIASIQGETGPAITFAGDGIGIGIGAPNLIFFEGPDFGRNYTSKAKDTPETTTSATPLVYDTLTVASDTLDPAGTYLCLIFAQGTASAAGTRVQMRGLLNGTPNDETNFTLRTADGRIPLLDMFEFAGSLNVSAPVAISIDVAKPQGPGEAGISRSLIAFWRVA